MKKSHIRLIDENYEHFTIFWIYALSIWLIGEHQSRFRHNAINCYWKSQMTDKAGKGVDREGRTLKWVWRNEQTGETFPDGKMPDDFYEDTSLDKYSWGYDGTPAYIQDFYDASDSLEEYRVQAETDAMACTVLAELLEDKPDSIITSLEALARIIDSGALLRAPSLMDDVDPCELSYCQEACAIEDAIYHIGILREVGLRQDARHALLGIERATSGINRMIELKPGEKYSDAILKGVRDEWRKLSEAYHATLLAEADYISAGSHDLNRIVPSDDLTVTEHLIVQAVKDLGPGRVKKAAIAKKLGYKSPASLDKPLASLAKRKILDSEGGPTGGYIVIE